MLKPQVINTETQKVWFTSDTHAYETHPFLLRTRGFKTPEEHTQWTIDVTNECVGENDILINAGDMFIGPSKDQISEYLNKVVCKNIYLLWGNHFSPLDNIYLSELANQVAGVEVYPYRWRNIVFVGNYLHLIVNEQPIIVTHFPQLVWDGMAKGSVSLCGHSHGSCLETRPDCENGKMLDIGLDVFRRPISFNEVMLIMHSKKFVRHDHLLWK